MSSLSLFSLNPIIVLGRIFYMHTVVCEQNHQGSLLQPYARHTNIDQCTETQRVDGWQHTCVHVEVRDRINLVNLRLKLSLYPPTWVCSFFSYLYGCVCLIHWTGYWAWQYGIQLIPPATPLTWLNNRWFNASQCVHRCVYTSIC